MVTFPSKSTALGATGNKSDALTRWVVDIEGITGTDMVQSLSVTEISLTESLLSPSLHSVLKIQDTIHTNPVKNLDKFAGKSISIALYRPALDDLGFNGALGTTQKVFRLDNRKPISNQIEEYTLHSCSENMLVNSAKRVSKSYDNQTPSQVTRDVLTSILASTQVDVEDSNPTRSYIAENIHPFQVIAQQADVALFGGDDPCFIHYMSLLKGGTNHFRSLKSLTSASTIFDFVYSEKGTDSMLYDPKNIMLYNFPCDFDILSDIENGINITGTENTSLFSYNSYNYVKNLLGVMTLGSGIGGALFSTAFTNKKTGPQAGTANDNSDVYMLRRQARMSLLDQDKVALQIVVPFNPNIYAGSMINVKFLNKVGSTELEYGSGDYLITTLTHSVRTGGYGISTADCVAKSVGLGQV